MVRKSLITALFAISFASLPQFAYGADPFPGVATGQEIPGYRVSGLPGQSQASFEATAAAQNFTCPSGAGKGLSVDLNFTTSNADDVVSYYCVKTWSDPETGEVAERAREQSARDAVQLQAQAKANELGIQACLPWSYTWRNGITQASGSVCAMPTAPAIAPLPSPTPSPTPSLPAADTPSAVAAAPTTSAAVASAPTTSAAVVQPQSPSTSASTSATSKSPKASSSADTTVVEDDGEEEDPAGSIRVRKTGAQYSLIIRTNISSDEIRVTAIKKGAKTIRWTVSTNDSGNVTIKSSRQLSGYRVTLNYQEFELDSVRVN